MKRLVLTITWATLCTSFFSQSPDLMSYQAVIRDAGNNLVTNQTVGIQISILNGYPFGLVLYVETHTPMSNDNGLVSLEIGNGSVVSGDMATIDWSSGEFYIKTETDPTGGTNYTITGVNQLLSVPFALYSKEDGDWKIDNDTLDSGNKLVGIGTSNPGAILEVVEDALISGLDIGRGIGQVAGNTVVGYEALRNITTQEGLTAIGTNAQEDAEGIGNTAIGSRALFNHTSSDYNTAVGYEAMEYGSGSTSYATALGYMANTSSSHDNSMALGSESMTSTTNQVRVGNTSVTSIGGYVGWTTLPSDSRFKEDVREDVSGLDFIELLRPVTYKVDVHEINDFLRSNFDLELNSDYPSKYKKEHLRYTGFIAQEVEQAAKEVGFDFSGVDKQGDDNGIYGLRYAEFVVPLVKAVQELDERTDKLDSDEISRIESIESQLEDIKSALARLQRDLANSDSQ